MEKKLVTKLDELRTHHPDAVLEVWAQDESRLGWKPIVRRVWAPRGQRPQASSTQRYAWLYVYGFVQPSTGATEWLILPTVRTDVMSMALQAFARATGAGPHKQIVLVLDGAGWHTSRHLTIPNGLHLLPLPAYTPELQPAECLWPLVREAVANETFSDLDALQERLSARCRTLAADQATVKAHTAFHWWPQP